MLKSTCLISMLINLKIFFHADTSFQESSVNELFSYLLFVCLCCAFQANTLCDGFLVFF